MAVALLCALMAIAAREGSAQEAANDGCTPTCVILIQVDGLEPKDVNEQTTPYLWRLAHPQVQGQSPPGSALDRRAGWIWQAARGVVGAGPAAATATLLSGGYPETSGVPADDFYGPTESGPVARQRLTAGGFGDTPHPEAGLDVATPVESLAVDTLIGVARQVTGVAVFLGDPGLAQLTAAATEGRPHWFPPGDGESASNAEDQFTGDPRLCPIPRYPDGGASFPGQQPSEVNFNPSHCPASDLTTLNKAAGDLTLPENDGVGFTFIHLAEVGAVKRLAADTDADGANENVVQPAQALSSMDQSIAMFAERYAQSERAKWDKTVLMVVGTNGYQRTPLVNRVPDPDATADPTRDLSDYVAAFTKEGVTENSLTLVPNGTTARIHYGRTAGAPDGRANALRAIKADLEARTDIACEERKPSVDGSGCLRGIYYVDPNGPAGETVPYKTWHLDTRDPETGARTRAGGDLVLELEPGWAFGRAVGLPYQGVVGTPFTNPHTASGGGPQERAVAALVNGPNQESVPGAVRNLGQTGRKYYPVTKEDKDPTEPTGAPPVADADVACPDVPTDPGGLACANDPERVIDDAQAPGHKWQPETVDFALTISALMKLPFETFPTQLQGRALQEAFLNKLETPCVGDCEPEVIEEQPEDPPPPPLPPPDVVVQPEGFNFHGLVRRLKALVVDSANRTYARARRGSVFSTIRLEGDFGKPEAAVTLTFYRRTATRRGRRSRAVRLRAIARFDPFVVKRGHVTMRLKVPPRFNPTYIGVTVRQIAHTAQGRRRLSGGQACTTLATRQPVRFRCTGPSAGAIVRIADSHRLHKRKGAPTRPRRTPRRR